MLSPSSIWSSFEQTPRTLRLVWASSRKSTLALGVLTLIAALLPLGIALAGKGIIDAVVARDTARTVRWVLVELGFIAAQSAVMQTIGLVRTITGARLALDINVTILEKALTLELRHFEDAEFYDQLTKARREASSRPLSIVTRSFQMGQSLITLVGYIGLLVHFSPWTVLGVVIAAIPATVTEMRFSNQAFRLKSWRSPESRKLMYLEYVLANDDHAKEVKLFGLGPMLLGRYKALGEMFVKDDRDLVVKRTGWGYGLSLLATGAFYGFYVLMALGAARGAISIGEMTLYMVAFRQGQQSFQALLSALGGMYEDNLYMSNLFKYLAIPVSSDVALLPKTTRTDGEVAERGIRFEDVGFKYPGREEFALRHVDIFIPAGQSLALVGQNGAGKTTFIKLLARLYEPTEGRILIDGEDLRAWDPDALRRRIGVIFQDFNQYQLKVKENVGVGSVAELEQEEQIKRAIDHGGAEAVVASLKEGIETPLGHWFKDGVELSGGQWQKIALARAFMREGADILVLDEPTSALDAEAEHSVFERFKKLTLGRTSILISHRFPTVRMADRILVIEGGTIVEQGTHHELVARDGRYAHLFELQARGYL
jgi:ATP-binding cassette, subfamily B, bacterial